MAGVSQAPVVQGRSQKSRYIASAALSVGVGAVSGYSAHLHAKNEIAQAAAKCDEALIRKKLLNFSNWSNGIPEASQEFFERMVQNQMKFAKTCLENTKKFYKGYAMETAIVATTVTALLTYIASLAFGGQKKS